MIGTLAVLERPGGWDEASITMRAERPGQQWQLTGEEHHVPDGQNADLVITAARTRAGVGLFAVAGDAPGLSRTPVPTLDQTRKQATLAYDRDRAIPSYVFPERAAGAVGKAAASGRWRREPAGVIIYPPGIDRKAARQLLASAGPGWLDAARSAALLRHYGISVAAGPESGPESGPGPPGGRPGDPAVRGILAIRVDPLVGRW